jgi:hypothetical protein
MVKILRGWKEIAYYLGVSIQTAKNWEKDRGLPVIRCKPYTTFKKTFTSSSLIDQWIEKNIRA